MNKKTDTSFILSCTFLKRAYNFYHWALRSRKTAYFYPGIVEFNELLKLNRDLWSCPGVCSNLSCVVKVSAFFFPPSVSFSFSFEATITVKVNVSFTAQQRVFGMKIQVLMGYAAIFYFYRRWVWRFKV